MNPFDDLLLWTSEKREGSVGELRRSCAWIAHRLQHMHPREVLDDLLACGHVDLEAGRWVVNPPLLSRLADGGGNALMVGARNRWLTEAIAALDLATDAGLAGLSDHVYENLLVAQEGPSAWYLAGGPETPWKAMEALGVRVMDDLAGAWLAQAVTDGPTEVPRTVRPGELVARLSDPGHAGTGPVWEQATSDRQPGLYVFLRNNQRIYARRTQELWLELGERWGVWTAPCRKRFWLVPRDRTLYVPAGVRLPLELERSLVARSGLLPTKGPAREVTGQHWSMREFRNITHDFAAQVAGAVQAEVEMA